MRSMGRSRQARAKLLALSPMFAFAPRAAQYVVGTLRPIASDAARHALKAGLSFVAAAIFVTLIRDPVEQNVIPWLIKLFSYEQALHIYTDPSSEADDKYDFLVPRHL